MRRPCMNKPPTKQANRARQNGRRTKIKCEALTRSCCAVLADFVVQMVVLTDHRIKGGWIVAETKNFSGSCLCGSVSFEIEPPSLWCAHCHCTMCRRAHGAAFITWVGADEKRFRLHSDKSVTWRNSSPEAERGFCHVCGSTLFFRSSRWPGEMHVVLANIDGEIDRRPAAHVFYQTHVDWFEVNDDLPRKP